MSRVYRYTVKGSGIFPLDMLRYDESYPATEYDSAVMDQDRSKVTLYKEVREVTLIHVHATDEVKYGGHWEPTSARWESFTWKVSECEELS